MYNISSGYGLVIWCPVVKAYRIALDGMPCFAASYLALFYLPKPHKKDARLICSSDLSRTKIIHGNDG